MSGGFFHPGLIAAAAEQLRCQRVDQKKRTAKLTSRKGESSLFR
jgi:hypothetical protein